MSTAAAAWAWMTAGEGRGAGAGLGVEALAAGWLEERERVDVCQLMLTVEVYQSVAHD